MRIIVPKYEVAKLTRKNGLFEYRVRKRKLFLFWGWLKDWSTAKSIDMSGGYTVDNFVFKTCEEAQEKVDERYSHDAAVKGTGINKIETIENCNGLT